MRNRVRGTLSCAYYALLGYAATGVRPMEKEFTMQAATTCVRTALYLTSTLLLAHCGFERAEPPSCVAGGVCASAGSSNGSSGAPAGGTSNVGANAAAGASGSSSAAAGVPSNGGNGGSTSVAGATALGGALAAGGSTALAGFPATAGVNSSGAVASGGVTSSGGVASSGAAGAAAGTSFGGATTGGAPASGGTTAGGNGSVVDQNGTALARPGDSKTGSREYLNLGDFRLLVNKWGSDELRCNTSMKVFVNTDKTFGWQFDRGACGGNKGKPDYPEIEFGIHPFGAGSSLATTPSFPSTKVLPLQIKDITSASILVDSLNANIQRGTTWNIDFEFWLSRKNPVTDPNPEVYAELIAFWGWQDSWACDQSGSVTAGDKSYSLCHQSDSWGSGWRYYQLRANSGSSRSFSGKVDIKALLEWLVNTHGFSKDLWLTRLEVGSELDDDTAGTVTLRNVTFEVNGTSKAAQFGE